MHCQVKAFIDLTGFALVTAAKDDPFDHRLAVQPAGLSVMQSNDTPLGVPPADTRPYKSIDLTNIIPALDASGNRRSCPVGTINDGTGCVFPYSSVCPKDTRLEGNNCISEKSPQCPEGLAYDGTNCVGKPPTCPSGSKFNGEACESEVMPLCDAHFAFKDGACVYDKTPVCLPSFHPKGRFCTSNITSHSMAECVSTLNILYALVAWYLTALPVYPKTPQSVSPKRPGMTISAFQTMVLAIPSVWSVTLKQSCVILL